MLSTSTQNREMFLLKNFSVNLDPIINQPIIFLITFTNILISFKSDIFKHQQQKHLRAIFYAPNVANLGFLRIVPKFAFQNRKLHFRTERAQVRKLAGGAFRGRPYFAHPRKNYITKSGISISGSSKITQQVSSQIKAIWNDITHNDLR